MKIYSFDEYYHMKLQADIYYTNMMKVFYDYITTNDEFIKKHGPISITRVEDISKNNFRSGGYIINYRAKDYSVRKINITDEEYNDMIKYMKDPELYDSVKKFNL